MRNRYSIEFEKYMKRYSKYHTLDELVNISNDVFNYNISKKALQKYLSRRKIRYKGYNPNYITIKSIHPIGYETKRTDGYTVVKTGENEWTYKQRVIYEQYHNIKLSKNDKIIFLDRDITNFNIDNLMLTSEKEYNYIKNKNLLTSDPEFNKTSILLAKVNYKTKEVQSKL